MNHAMNQQSKFFEKTPVAQYLQDMNELGFEGRMIVPIVAMDDGYAQYNSAVLLLKKEEKEVVAEISEDVMPAIAKRGQHLHGYVGGNAGLYGTLDTNEQFSVNKHVSGPEDTRKENYPESSLNLCLTHAALDRLGLEGQQVAIVTGLPLEECMDGENGYNSTLIAKKTANLKRPVYITEKTRPSAEIVFAGVYPEAIAGIVDYMLDEFGNLRAGIDPDVVRLAIDIGGNTTDLAIILPGNIVGAKMTLKLGVKHVKDHLRRSLMKRFDLEPDDSTLEDALQEKKIQWFGGEVHVVTNEVEAAVQSVMGPIAEQIETFKKEYPSLKESVGFGGGVALMKDVIKETNPNIIVMDNPDGANARGFLKCALIYDFENIMAAVKAFIAEKSKKSADVAEIAE